MKWNPGEPTPTPTTPSPTTPSPTTPTPAPTTPSPTPLPQTYSATDGSAVASHSTAANGNFPSNGGFQLDTADFGSVTLTTWTIAYDVRIASSTGTYFGLLQADVTNGGDADLFFKKSGSAYGVGLGIYGTYFLAVDTWARVVVTYDGSTVTVYHDGEEVNGFSRRY